MKTSKNMKYSAQEEVHQTGVVLHSRCSLIAQDLIFTRKILCECFIKVVFLSHQETLLMMKIRSPDIGENLALQKCSEVTTKMNQLSRVLKVIMWEDKILPNFEVQSSDLSLKVINMSTTVWMKHHSIRILKKCNWW